MKRNTITRMLILVSVLLFAGSAFAAVQEEWMVRYNEDDATFSSGNTIFIDSSDYIYVVGSLRETNTYEILVVKFDGSGNVVWDRLLSGRTSTNIYTPMNAATLDPWDNVVVGGAAGSSGAFILKMDPLGNTLWEKTTTSSNSYLNIESCPGGSLVAMGSSSVAKYAQDGSLQWERSANGTYYALATDSSCNVHISGSSSYNGVQTPTLWSYDAGGNYQFTAYGDSSAITTYTLVAADADGNVIANGSYYPLNITDKYDMDGNLLWSTEYQKASARVLKTDAEGSILLGGSITGSYNWPEFSVWKYSDEGNFLWKRSYYSYGDSSVYGLNVGYDGSVYATGELGYCPGSMKTMKFGADGSVQWNFQKYLQFDCASINYGFDVAADSIGNTYAAGHTTYPYYPWTRKLTLIKYTQSCSGKPSVDITGFGPELLWPPDHKEQDVTVTGTVTLPSGCSLTDAGYSVLDEYGDYSSNGALSVDAYGQFSLSVPLESWRNGSDRDGRDYSITVSFTDWAGTTSKTFSTVVPHDKGK